MRIFWEHPFQQGKSICITALDGRKVVGHNHFFYWPYLLNGKLLQSYQSGDSIVHPDYRGHRIFSRILCYLNEVQERHSVDFLTGFPGELSFNSFIRNGWSNILNLKWYVKILGVSSLFRRVDAYTAPFDTFSAMTPSSEYSKGFSLSYQPDFRSWRESYSKHNLDFYYSGKGCWTQFELKVNLCKRIKGLISINELIIGRVRTNCYEINFLQNAIKSLIRKVREQRMFTFLSVALNPQHYRREILQAFILAGFRPSKKQSYFIVKDFTVGQELFQPQLWELYMSDLDTW